MQRRTALFVLAGTYVTPVFALYDPKPEEWLAVVQGEWRGSLTYRDYGDPKRMVTLPTRLFVTLGSPTELVLHYVFADGPSKTVYSYERMNFDLAGGRIAWSAGSEGKSSMHGVTSDTTNGGARTVVFERKEEGGLERFVFEASARRLRLSEDEVAPTGEVTFRNRYEFSRPAPDPSR